MTVLSLIYFTNINVCTFTLIPIVPKDNYINNFSLVIVLVKHSIGEGVGL